MKQPEFKELKSAQRSSMFSFLLFLTLFTMALLSIVAWSIKNGISPMPSSAKAQKKIMEIAPSVTEGTVYDLGSGWGNLVFPLAKRYPNLQVVGYETSPIPYLFTKLRLLFDHCPNLRLINQDFFTASIEDASLVVCYLYPGAMQALKEKFVKELKPGTWIISNTFALAGWVPEEIFTLDDLYLTKIYLYKIN